MSSGNVGTVYEGRYKSNNKKVCLKFLIKEDRFLQDTKEIDIHNSLKDKSVIKIYEYIPFKYSFSSLIVVVCKIIFYCSILLVKQLQNRLIIEKVNYLAQ